METGLETDSSVCVRLHLLEDDLCSLLRNNGAKSQSEHEQCRRSNFISALHDCILFVRVHSSPDMCECAREVALSSWGNVHSSCVESESVSLISGLTRRNKEGFCLSWGRENTGDTSADTCSPPRTQCKTPDHMKGQHTYGSRWEMEGEMRRGGDLRVQAEEKLDEKHSLGGKLAGLLHSGIPDVCGYFFKKHKFSASRFGKKKKILYKMILSTCSCTARDGNMGNIIRTRWKPEVKREKKKHTTGKG